MKSPVFDSASAPFQLKRFLAEWSLALQSSIARKAKSPSRVLRDTSSHAVVLLHLEATSPKAV